MNAPTVPRDALSTLAARHFRRNYALSILNGGVFGFVDSVISPYLVLSLFVHQLGGSSLLVGLLPAIYNGGWFLPQFLISHRLQELPYKKTVYNLASVVRAAAWAALILATFLVDGTHPTLLLILFFVFYTTYNLFAGVAGAPFMDIVAKTIPVARRGTFFGRRDLAGAAMAIGAGYLIELLLSPDVAPPFPLNFGWIFILAGVAIAIGLGAFAFVVEPPESASVSRITFREQLRAAQSLWRTRYIYRRYLLTRIAFAAADIATPFYAIYATTVLQIPAETVGLYIAFTTGAMLITNPLLSRLSDQRGHRLVLLIATAGMVAAPILALLFGLLPGGPWLGIPFGVVFVLIGISRTSGNIANPSYLLEIATADERPLYIGLTNTVLGIATLLPIAGGVLLDLAGFNAILLVTVSLGALSLKLAAGMIEPRALDKPLPLA